MGKGRNLFSFLFAETVTYTKNHTYERGENNGTKNRKSK